MLASVTALLASHIAAGGLFVTAVLGYANPVPRAFLRFCTASCAGAAAVAVALDSESTRWLWLGLALASAAWYVALRRNTGSGKLASALAAVLSIAVLVAAALATSEGAHGIAVAGAISSSLLLGAVIITMVLGHWYLVDTTLSIAPLRDGARWFSIAVVLRWAAVAIVLVYGGWEVLRVSRAADLIFSTNGLFFLFRALMGLAAPLLLSTLIWQTVKMRSTQSATGLLYVALILVLFGELVSQFLLVRTGYPL